MESKLNFLSFLSLFFLFLSSLFHVNILLYLHKRSSGNRSLVYVLLTENKNLSSYLRLYKKRYYSNFRVFLSRPHCMQCFYNFTFSFFETLIQELVTHCHYYLVRECYVLQSLLQNCTCPHRQGGATGCQPSMAASFRMKRPTPHCQQRDVQVLVSVDISITKDKIPDSEAMHFLPRSLAGTLSPLVG